MQKLLVEVLCPVLCKRSGYHSWMASSVLRICKTQVFQLPKFFPHFTSFLSFLQWDEWFLKMKIINVFKISINSDKDWVNRGQYGESESLAWDMPTARLRCCTSGTSNQMREQPAITGRTDGISPFYLSTLRPQAAYLFYYFFFCFQSTVAEIYWIRNMRRRLGLVVCRRQKHTQMTNLSILQITVPVFWPPLILIRFSSNS